MTDKYQHVEEYTPAFRATFVNVATPNTFDPDKPAYDLRALYPNLGNNDFSNLQWFYEMRQKCAQINSLIDANGAITCSAPDFADGNAANCFSNDTNEQYEGHKDHWWMKYRSGSNNGEPVPFGIVDINGQAVEASQIYPGIFLRGMLRMFPFNHPKFGLQIIMRMEHLQVVGYGEPFASVGGNISTSKVFEGAAPVVGLPAGVAQTSPVASAPQAQPGPGSAPQAQPGPGSAPQAQPGPGSAPQASAAPTGQVLSPGQFVKEFNNATPAVEPTLTPLAGEHTLEQWRAVMNDDELRAKGIII